ncbi:Phosphoesterase PA-phosphatase related (fragment) [Mesorhizobium metallidurans STM 2683]|uniref:Phosphoesterase PA-phosphatase related n=1 Tax=Mesorhizobium metallidurans STM 2683 TaxID=1297569 RepID=M5EWT6_9HYPH
MNQAKSGKSAIAGIQQSANRQLPERATLITIVLLTSSVLVFLALASLVMRNWTADFDRAILLIMRNPTDLADPIGPTWFEELMRDVSGLGGLGLLTFVTLTVAGFLALSGSLRNAIAVILAVGSGVILSSLLKYGFDRPRPDLVAYGTRIYTSSFPSGHAFMAATVYFTLGIMLARKFEPRPLRVFIMAISMLVTFAVGASRIYLGVHWPTDVIAGWSIGAGWALFCSTLIVRLKAD